MRISVMLTARDDGFKCKPFVLPPRPDPKVVIKLHNKLELHWEGSTWMNDASIGVYLQKVLGVPLSGKRLLVWDTFSAQKSETTKEKRKELQIGLILVYGGCTKFIQAPDVVSNVSFKAKLRLLYEHWMANGPKPVTRNGNPAPPPVETYLD